MTGYKKMLSWVALALLIQETLTYRRWISVNNGGYWGDWGILEECPPETSARGFSLKVERPLGSSGDDTALNTIKLHCATKGSTSARYTITSTEGNWGAWTSVSWCPSGNLIRFSLTVDKPQGEDDDTAANNIMMQCSDRTVLTGNGGYWGNYGSWSGVCLEGICGIITRVQRAQGRGDDTALNDVQFECC
ncbi:vitelline membrane outer layer protein 1 homolog isoform X2 [Dendropsophus ebraccatus]|uniref:vitelline membrane outer layer protein 1 homolog isoform X2 n=1 Tax=Dendropsophus ebraccatus TaxID=150705 RepID=UPI00383210C4